MNQNRKRPVRLEIETTLTSESNSGEAQPVRIRGSTIPSPTHSEIRHSQSVPIVLAGVVKIRREVKGRSGKPVTVLFDFSDPNANHLPSLKALQAQLKEKLACGGTFDPVEKHVILQVDDLGRVRSVLEKLGFVVKG